MIKSPLKWAGGKTRVLPELPKHLPKAAAMCFVTAIAH